MLDKQQKKALIDLVADKAARASSCVVAEYRGLTVGQMTALRAEARKRGVFVKVVRNTLARQALVDTNFAAVAPAMKGAVLMAFSFDAPGDAARLFRDFVKENELLRVTALSIGADLMDGASLNAVADLPNFEEAVTKLAVTTKALVGKLAVALGDIPGRIVRVTAAIQHAT